MDPVELQMRFLAEHGVLDKDAKPKHIAPPRPASGEHRPRSSSDGVVIDLHGLTVEEAMTVVEDMLVTLRQTRTECLQIVHGTGHPDFGPIARELHRRLRGPWKDHYRSFSLEENNPGCTTVWLRR